MATLDDAQKKYVQSQAVTDAYNSYTNLQNNKPSDYQSQYGTAISDILGKIQNREKFSYDFNADPVYQQYKDQYTQGGKQAMIDTTAQAAALSGGYGNSYGATAGSQAYQAYLTQLNNIIPDLQANALSKYQAEGDELQNQYAVLSNAEDNAYNQWSNNYNLWQNDTSNALSAYSTLYSNDYSDYQQQIANAQYALDYAMQQAEYEESIREYNASLAEEQRQFDANLAASKSSSDQSAKIKQLEALLAAAQANSGSSTGSPAVSTSTSSSNTVSPYVTTSNALGLETGASRLNRLTGVSSSSSSSSNKLTSTGASSLNKSTGVTSSTSFTDYLKSKK